MASNHKYLMFTVYLLISLNFLISKLALQLDRYPLPKLMQFRGALVNGNMRAYQQALGPCGPLGDV